MHVCVDVHKDYALDLIWQLEKLPWETHSLENFSLVVIAIMQPSIAVQLLQF